MLLDIENIIDVFEVPKFGLIHVGAHYGQEFERYERLNFRNVVMFEPCKKNFEVLKRNLVGKEVTLVNKGLSQKSETSKMYVENANSGMSNSLLKPLLHSIQYPHIKFEDEEIVELVSLDEWYFENQLKCNVLTIDVQGYEMEVLLGSLRTLPHIDMIVCEVNRAELYENGAHITEIDVFLRSQGFRRVATNWEGRSWGDAAYLRNSLIEKKGFSVPTIDLIDSSFSHTRDTLGFDSACLLPTSRFDWNRNMQGDSSFVVVTDSSITQECNKDKVAWLIEPRVISPSPYDYAKLHEKEFVKIVSHDLEFISTISNGVYSPIGGTWIEPKDWPINFQKTKNISIIASKKTQTEGHRLRHDAALLLHSDDRYGKAYTPIDKKIFALRDYRFSIVVENSKAQGYFSEKLIDCLITCTIPIYWGSATAIEIFDKRGIIVFENIDHLKEILETMDFKKFYNDAKDAIVSNAKKSRRFSSIDDTFFSAIIGIS